MQNGEIKVATMAGRRGLGDRHLRGGRGMYFVFIRTSALYIAVDLSILTAVAPAEKII